MERIQSTTYRRAAGDRLSKRTTKEKPTLYAPRPMGTVPAQVCAHCHGDGWLRRDVPLGHPEFGKPVRCQCKAEESLQRSLARTYAWTGADEKQVRALEAMTFASFNQHDNGPNVAEAYQRARRYADELITTTAEQKNLSLIGSPGRGKTHLGCSVVAVARAAGIGCLYVSGNEFFQALFNAGLDERYIRQATEVPLLFWDDIDKMQLRGDGSYQRTTLFTVFNQRYLAHRPTILTANADDNWRPWFHEAILSRFFGHAEIIGIQGQDYRLMSARRQS